MVFVFLCLISLNLKVDTKDKIPHLCVYNGISISVSVCPIFYSLTQKFGCSQILANVNSAAMNMVHMPS